MTDPHLTQLAMVAEVDAGHFVHIPAGAYREVHFMQNEVIYYETHSASLLKFGEQWPKIKKRGYSAELLEYSNVVKNVFLNPKFTTNMIEQSCYWRGVSDKLFKSINLIAKAVT